MKFLNVINELIVAFFSGVLGFTIAVPKVEITVCLDEDPVDSDVIVLLEDPLQGKNVHQQIKLFFYFVIIRRGRWVYAHIIFYKVYRPPVYKGTAVFLIEISIKEKRL